jgi:thiol-disulfide isomerase/thioredoxin
LLVVNSSNAWLREHPRPRDGDPPEKRRAWGSELLARSLEWIATLPDDPIGYMQRVQALISLNAPAEDIARAGDELLALIRREDPTMATWIVSLARDYTEGGVLLDRVPALISEAIERLDDPEAVIQLDFAPHPDITASNQSMVLARHASGLVTLAKSYEKRGETEKAQEALRQAEDFMASHPMPPDEAGMNVRPERLDAQVGFWQAKAEMAEREGRKLDALSWYRRSQSSRPRPNGDILNRERRLWKELGGSDEGWQHWIDPVAAPTQKTPAATAGDPGGSSINRRLPPLSVKDIAGNQWTLDRFAGKTTVAVVWATWCEPCRAELRYFAKLVDRLKGRSDVLAISFNTDDNIALAETFVRSAGYTFPVLSSKQYAEDLMPLMSIPRIWIIRNGVIAEERSGFGRDGDKWVEEMLARLKQ